MFWGSLLNSRHPDPRNGWKGGSEQHLMTPLPVPNSGLPEATSELPVANSGLPVGNSRLPAANSGLPVANSGLSMTNPGLPVANPKGQAKVLQDKARVKKRNSP